MRAFPVFTDEARTPWLCSPRLMLLLHLPPTYFVHIRGQMSFLFRTGHSQPFPLILTRPPSRVFGFLPFAFPFPVNVGPLSSDGKSLD